MKATNKDLWRWYKAFEHCKMGYCCYKDAGKARGELLELGYNSGVCGWNWTTYADTETDTLYISYYRNVPSYIVEK